MHDIEITYGVETAMRDGVILRSDLYQPKGDGPFPVLLVRSPYDKLIPLETDYAGIARTGYIVVAQDTRGSFTSDGEWLPWKYEREDGYDTVEWAAALPRSNGKVGMMGQSYHGSTAWSAAISQPPHLAAIAPFNTWSDPEDGLMFRGGAIELGLNGFWGVYTAMQHLPTSGKTPENILIKVQETFQSFDTAAAKGYWGLPAGALPMLERTGLPDVGVRRAFDNRSTMDECRVSNRYDDIEVPALIISGWFDVFQQGALDNFVGMQAKGKTARLVVGPWTHQSNLVIPSPRAGDVGFGLASGFPGGRSVVDAQLQWFDRWLTDEPTRDTDEPPVLIFVMGTNQWRAETEWPLAREEAKLLYLANDSTLSWTPPTAEESESTYVYDPADPALTRGGDLVMALDYPAGVFSQHETEARDDVLVFTTLPLDDDVEITGRVTATLFAATDGPSTDWVVRLCEVDSKGISRNLIDGIARVRTEPNRIDEVQIDLWSTSIVVRAGHRLRVHVTSSNFPRWDRNLNTGERETEGTTMRVAHQRIIHDTEHPSHITLPIIPA